MGATETLPLLLEPGAGAAERMNPRRSYGRALLLAVGAMMIVAGSFAGRRRATGGSSPTVLLADAPATAVMLGDEQDGSTLAPVHVTTEECTGDTSKPVARGADVVAYRSLQGGQPAVYGSKRYSAVYGGYHFFFSTLENKQEFERNPVRYLPAYGGFCSYGISHESIWNVDDLGPPANPDFWLIYDDQLYLFRSPTPFGKFQEQTELNIGHGNLVWFQWFGELAHTPLTPFNTACFCSEETCEDG